MQPDHIFWIASMTKPVTAVALLMLQDEGKLSVDDPVSKYIPEFMDLKAPSGKDANLTITQIMNHTSGLREADAQTAMRAKELADLIPSYVSGPTLNRAADGTIANRGSIPEQELWKWSADYVLTNFSSNVFLIRLK
jgi:CubicO group peptidase (beta-lactamase class C family)